ncbi:MAG: restriction endonuclease [Bacteroidota bacterium]
MNDVFVLKSSGERNKFSEKKIRQSLQRVGATEEQVRFILNEIKEQLYEGISTKSIYKLAFRLLKDSSRHLAARYNLKQGIMELGPSGFPFEKFVAEILNAQGYKTRIGQILKGKCVNHEIDVIAEKEDHTCIIECKYHNLRGIVCNVKVPLYIHSRFQDVKSGLSGTSSHSDTVYEGWVVTNTRFTSDALQYGNCAGLNLLGWDYPANKSLRHLIDSLGLYPVTCLTSLTKFEKEKLLERKIVLSREIVNNESLLAAIGLKQARRYTVMKEAQQLCARFNTHENKK